MPRPLRTAAGRPVSFAESSGQCSCASELSPAGLWNCGASLHDWPKRRHARSRAIVRTAVRSSARRMATVILQTFQVCNPPAPARSIHEWTRSPRIARLKLAEINRIEGLHEELSSLPGFKTSDYQPGARRGEIVAGIRSEDLTKLTYPDESFDLVLLGNAGARPRPVGGFAGDRACPGSRWSPYLHRPPVAGCSPDVRGS